MSKSCDEQRVATHFVKYVVIALFKTLKQVKGDDYVLTWLISSLLLTNIVKHCLQYCLHLVNADMNLKAWFS